MCKKYGGYGGTATAQPGRHSIDLKHKRQPLTVERREALLESTDPERYELRVAAAVRSMQ